jgi:hypothetical protein
MVSETHKVIYSSGHSFKYEGVFDLNRLYSEMSGWISENNYDFEEKEHSDKKKDKGQEIKYVFLGEKKVTDYIKYNVKVEIFAVEINKMSENLVSGKLNIVFNANVELDYKNKWGITRMSKFFFNIYNNYLMKGEIGDHMGKLYDETVDLQDLAKDVLDFNR